jgi:cytochrome c oxidase assembly protein subunit 11
MFCAATGFAGTPKVGTGRFEPERLVPVEDVPRIKVHFNADKSEQLPWTFTPQQKFVTVLPGETSLAFYTARNKSDKDIIGIATYNVTPDRVRSNTPAASRQIDIIPHSGRTIFFKGRMLLL